MDGLRHAARQGHSILIGHALQVGVGKNERTIEQFCVVIDKVGKTNSGNNSDGEDLLHGIFEFHPAYDLPGLNVNRPDATCAFLLSLCNRNAAEDRGFANL